VRDTTTEEPNEYDSKTCVAKIFDHASIQLRGAGGYIVAPSL
jgi:hypothetical protein